jgi:KDO2-lipid IV(A) lauroyltransferase
MNEYLSYKLAAFLSRAFPRKLAYWIGLRIADLYFLRDRRGREGIRSNLKTIFARLGIVPAEQTLNGFVRKTFQYFGKYLVDFFRYSRLTPDDLRRMVSIGHREHLDQAVAAGKGVILVGAHLGNWELGGAVVASLGYRFNAVVLPYRMEKINRLFRKYRESRGIHVIRLGDSAFSLVRCLKRGEIVALLADRDFTHGKNTIDFFGKPAHLPDGPARLSFRTGAPILPATLMCQVDDTFLLQFHPPILPEQAGSVDAIRLRIRDVLEQVIAEQPYQWYIFDDFWAGEKACGEPGGKT